MEDGSPRYAWQTVGARMPDRGLVVDSHSGAGATSTKAYRERPGWPIGWAFRGDKQQVPHPTMSQYGKLRTKPQSRYSDGGRHMWEPDPLGPIRKDCEQMAADAQARLQLARVETERRRRTAYLSGRRAAEDATLVGHEASPSDSWTQWFRAQTLAKAGTMDSSGSAEGAMEDHKEVETAVETPASKPNWITQMAEKIWQAKEAAIGGQQKETAPAGQEQQSSSQGSPSLENAPAAKLGSPSIQKQTQSPESGPRPIPLSSEEERRAELARLTAKREARQAAMVLDEYSHGAASRAMGDKKNPRRSRRQARERLSHRSASDRRPNPTSTSPTIRAELAKRELERRLYLVIASGGAHSAAVALQSAHRKSAARRHISSKRREADEAQLAITRTAAASVIQARCRIRQHSRRSTSCEGTTWSEGSVGNSEAEAGSGSAERLHACGDARPSPTTASGV